MRGILWKKSGFTAGVVALGCLLLPAAAPTPVRATPWTVDVAVSPPAQARTITSPVNPERKVVTDTTYTTVQTTTEMPLPGGAPLPLLPPGTVRFGLDSFISDKQQIFDIPMGYSFTRSISAELTIPVGAISHQDPAGEWRTDGAVGDIVLSGRYVLGSETLGLGTVLSLKFPSGDPEKAAGTGTYDLAMTEKGIMRSGPFLFTGMLGYTLRSGAPTIYGQSVTFGDTFAWMAGSHYQAWRDRLWVGLKVSGNLTTQSKIRGYGQNDRLNTVDLTPEARFFFSRQSAVCVGVMFPAVTSYDLINHDRRETVVNAGFFTYF